MPFCPACGYEMSSTDRFCYHCGKQVFNEFLPLSEKRISGINLTQDIKTSTTQTSKIESFPNIYLSGQHKKENVVQSETEILNLPYSWTSNNIEITLLGLAQVEGYERGIPLDNKKQYEVIIKFRNLLKTSNKITGSSLGFDSLKLKTDVGNIWDLRYNVGTSIMSETLDPQDEFIRNESLFEIRTNEVPEYLLAEIFGKKYVFNVKMIANRKYRESNERYQLR
jgi:hypothetical protein